MSQQGSYGIIIPPPPAGYVETLTGNTGGRVPPTNFNINILTNNTNVLFNGNIGTSTLTLDFGIPNIVLGTNAIAFTSGIHNYGLGANVLGSVVTGYFNIGIGGNTLSSLVSGIQNIAIGESVLTVATGSYNIGIGVNALTSLTTPPQNIAIGPGSLSLLVSGTGQNVAIGYAAGGTITSGASNIFLGYNTGINYTGAETNNILIGSAQQGVVGDSNTIRIGNSSITRSFMAGVYGVSPATPLSVVINAAGQLGTSATPLGAVITLTGDTGGAVSPTAGNINVIAGNITQNCGSSVSIIGTIISSRLLLNVTDANSNTIIGLSAGNSTLSGSGNTGLGAGTLARLVSGNLNTAVGSNAGAFNSTSSRNVAVGVFALGNATGAIGSFGFDNTAIGNYAGGEFIPGTGNVLIGNNVFSDGQLSTITGYNTCVGFNSLSSATGAQNNTCLGYATGANYLTTESNNILIGYNVAGTVTESNVIRIGNSSNASCYIAGIDGVALTTANVVTEASNQLGTAVITAGTGISVTAGANTITIAATSSGFTWHDVTGGSATLAAENGYIADAAGLTTFTMPTNNAIGDTIKIVGKGAGGWKIVYSANQNIIFGSSATTVTTGNLASTNANDCCELVCTTASATQPIFTVVSSIGNLAVT